MLRCSWFLLFVLAVVSLPGCATEPPGPETDDQPLNFILILVDDLGWKDTGVYGTTFYETPNIDQLARNSMRFTQFYSAGCVCSPTRASIMTGKHPARLNITDWISGSQSGRLLPATYDDHLPLKELTLGEAFQAQGYLTAYIGKWHLGGEPYFPDQQGFRFTRAVAKGGYPATYFYPYRNPHPSNQDVPDLESGKDGEYLTDRLTDEAIHFLGENLNRPFLLTLSHYAVHVPLESKPELVQKYDLKASRLPAADGPGFLPEGGQATTKQLQDNTVYAGMIESLDESVGRIRSALKELGIAGDTALILVSDNGGLSTLASDSTAIPTPSTSNLPLRAGKGWLYEGGIRAPLMVSWPGVVRGGSENDEPVISMDLFPTLLEMAVLKLLPDQHQDGTSLVPLLTESGDLEREAIFWHYPHYLAGNSPSGAVRAGDYKLIEWFEDDRVELYNLAEDIGEANDLASRLPDKTEELRELLQEWRRETDARMPTLNPKWTPEN